MRIRTLMSLATAAFLITACSNEEELISTSTGGILKATVEGSHSGTRAGFAADGSFYWSKNDQLGVTTSNGNNSFTALTLATGGGTASATFNGPISGTIGEYAVYPFNENHSMNSTTLTYHFPATYTYTQVDADYFTTNQGEGNSFNPAMWGKIENGGVQMKHLGGVFCIKISKMPVTAGTLSLIADKNITGDFTVDLNGNEAPAASAGTETTDNANGVEIMFSNATVDQPGVFYVPVPTGTYEVRIKVKETATDSSDKINVAAGVYTIARCDLKRIELSNGSVDVTVPTASTTLSDAASALGTNDAVTVTDKISATNNSISIPAVSGTSADTGKSLSLEKVESGASLTVSDAANDNGSSVANFTLSIPNNETDNFTPLDVTIAMPNTTVTLSGNAGVASYGTVTAETADNTLVISNGVKVKKVIVKKGNLRVNAEAKLEAIEKGSENSSEIVTIYVEKGAEIPAVSGEGFVVVDAAVADLKNVLRTGGSYDLAADMEGDFVVSAKEPVTINLNGHTITNKADHTFTVNLGSSLTITGTGAVDNITHKKACIYNNGTVKLEGGTYTRSAEVGTDENNAGGNSYYNILNHGEMTIGSDVEVSQRGKYSSLIANGYYSYTNSGDPMQGYQEGTNQAEPKLTIHGGKFTGGLNTIKNDDGATLEIIGGVFENMAQAAVQNHHVTTISGGSFRGLDAKYVVDNEGHNNDAHDLGDMTITGGQFFGKINNSRTGADMTITGGEFSDPAALQYLGANANVKVKLIADETVRGFITKSGQTVEIDMGDKILTLADPTVGSAGTETNSCQLLAGSTVTFMNGTLTSGNANIVIQNYSTLHLQGVTLNTPNASYSISNNNGRCTLDNVTINAATGKCAFDVYAFSTYEGVEVIVNSGTINGNVEFGGNNNKKNIKLAINGGTFNGNLTVDTGYYDTENPNITISDAAVFGSDVTGWDTYKNNNSNSN